MPSRRPSAQRTTTTTAISVDGRRYRGITKILQDAFYSNYKPPLRYRRTGRSRSSCARGEIAHRQLFHAFHCAERPRCECRERFGVRSPTRRIRPSLFVQLFEEVMHRQQWEFVEGEVAVAWRDLGVATYIDAVVRHRLTRALYVVEFKTGYPRESRKRASTRHPLIDGGHFEHLQTLDNCPMNQHHLQLWFGVEALRRTWRHERVADGVLLYFDSDGVSLEWHQRWRTHEARDALDRIEPALRAHLEATRSVR